MRAAWRRAVRAVRREERSGVSLLRRAVRRGIAALGFGRTSR
jgi:hypothetical protein